MKHHPARIVLRTLLHAILAILVIAIVDFLLLKLTPGDAADALAAASGSATTETMQAWRTQFGLDLSLFQQLLAYLGRLAQCDLGYSPLYNARVAALIFDRLPNSLLLMACGLGLAVVLGVLFGTVMALARGTWLDRLLSGVVLLLYSLPGFWIGLMLIIVFSVWLGWLPAGGAETMGQTTDLGGTICDRLSHLVLPSLSLATFYIAVYARLMRASVTDVMRRDFVRTARAKGAGLPRIVLRHMLPNALLPVTTVMGMQMGGIMGGSVVIESVFGWPGLGGLAFDALVKRDFSVILGILLLSAVVVLFCNVLTDLLQAWLDPRIELG